MFFMKIFILSFLLSLTSFATETTLELLNKEFSNRNNGDEVMEVLKGAVNFIGYKRKLVHQLAVFTGPTTLEDLAEVPSADKYRKGKYFKEGKVKRKIKELKKECADYAADLNEDRTIMNEEYYCSDLFVYTGDVKNPELEGQYHTANGQMSHLDANEAAGVKSPSKTRQSLDSNNEKYGDYEVYTIGLMRRWN